MEQVPFKRLHQAGHCLTHGGVALVCKHWLATTPSPERRAAQTGFFADSVATGVGYSSLLS